MKCSMKTRKGRKRGRLKRTSATSRKVTNMLDINPDVSHNCFKFEWSK